MSDDEAKVFFSALAVAQLAVLAWVLVRHRGMRPILIVNLLFAVGILLFVLEYLPGEIAYIREGEASELFDYKNTILTAFAAIMLIASAFAWRGVLLGKVIAWLCFAGDFVLSLAAALFFLTFKFKCCGYL